MSRVMIWNLRDEYSSAGNGIVLPALSSSYVETTKMDRNRDFLIQSQPFTYLESYRTALMHARKGMAFPCVPTGSKYNSLYATNCVVCTDRKVYNAAGICSIYCFKALANCSLSRLADAKDSQQISQYFERENRKKRQIQTMSLSNTKEICCACRPHAKPFRIDHKYTPLRPSDRQKHQTTKNGLEFEYLSDTHRTQEPTRSSI